MKSLNDMFAELDKRILDSNKRWENFMHTFSNYEPVMKLPSTERPIPPPLMTGEKLRKMQMYKKQACITEVRIKSRLRERDLMNKVQVALDEIRDFHVSASDSSSEGSARSATDSSISQSTSSQSTAIENLPNSKLTQGPSKMSAIGNRILPDIPKFTFNEAHTQRKRNSSESATHDDTGGNESKPPHHSSHPNQHSGPRQRYREEKSRALQEMEERRALTPILVSGGFAPDVEARPASTPPAVEDSDVRKCRYVTISNSPEKHSPLIIESCETTPSKSNDARKLIKAPLATITEAELKDVLQRLSPNEDSFRWLGDKVSKGETTVTTVEEWFQNAPDSVKQRLNTMLDISSAAESKETSNNIHISPVLTCRSVDDTLRSASPISEDEASVMAPSIPLDDPLPMTVVRKKSIHTSNRLPTSSTALSVSTIHHEASLKGVVKSIMSPRSQADLPTPERSQQMPQRSHSSLHTSTPDVKHGSKPANNKGNSVLQSIDLTIDSDIDDSVMECRRRNLSAQSYTIEEPSQALLDFTCNEASTSSTKPKKSKIPTPKKTETALEKSIEWPHQPVRRSKSERQLKKEPEVKVVERPITPVVKHRLLRRVLDDAEYMRSMTPTPPTRPKTPTSSVKARPKTAMGMEIKHDANRKEKMGRTVNVQANGSLALQRSKSLKQPSMSVEGDSNQDLARSKSVKLMRAEKMSFQDTSNAKNVVSDTLMKARKHLLLLKQKVAMKTSPRDNIHVQPTLSRATLLRTPQKNKAEVRHHNECSANITDKENNNSQAPFISASTRSRNAEITDNSNRKNNKTPVLRRAGKEKKTCNGVLAVSHKPNTAHPESGSTMYSRKVQRVTNNEVNNSTNSKLTAIVKGHLCRKLMQSYKVKSIVKTIQDCQSLLPNSTAQLGVQTTLGEINFQERLLEQMQAAKDDLSDIFLVLSDARKIALIKQSEMIETRAKQRSRNSQKEAQGKTKKTTTQTTNNHRRLPPAKPEPRAETAKKGALAPKASKSSPLRSHSMALMV